MGKEILNQPSGQGQIYLRKHSLCLWADSGALGLYEERSDCDRKQGLSAAGA